jgi:hypothetical protein
MSSNLSTKQQLRKQIKRATTAFHRDNKQGKKLTLGANNRVYQSANSIIDEFSLMDIDIVTRDDINEIVYGRA